MWKTSNCESKRTFQTLFSTALSIGQVTYAFLLTVDLAICWNWENWTDSLKDCTHCFGLKCWAWWEWFPLVLCAFEEWSPGSGWVLAICLHANAVLIRCRTMIQPCLAEFKTFVVSSSPSAPCSLSVLHMHIFQCDPSYPLSHIYQASSVHSLLRASKWKQGDCCHGQHRHWNGLDTWVVSDAWVVHPMGAT